MKANKIKSLFERSNRLVDALDNLYSHGGMLSRVVESRGGDNTAFDDIADTLNVLESQIQNVVGQIFEDEFVDDGSSQEVWDEVERMRGAEEMPSGEPSDRASTRGRGAPLEPTALPKRKPTNINRRMDDGSFDPDMDGNDYSHDGFSPETPTPRRKPSDVANMHKHDSSKFRPSDELAGVPEDLRSMSGERPKYRESIERLRTLANISENEAGDNK